MKIEKLTENKIRVVINASELSTNDTDINDIMRNAMDSQELFLDILKKAEKELSFYTDGCKLLIEAFSSLEDCFVFTITKYLPKPPVKKLTRPTVKRKSFVNIHDHIICCFEDFNNFCDFCQTIKNLHRLNNDKIIQNTSLYFWNDSYYLILKSIDKKSENSFLLYSILSEFTKKIAFSNDFESKLLEYGQIIMKKNAITTGIKFFC